MDDASSSPLPVTPRPPARLPGHGWVTRMIASWGLAARGNRPPVGRLRGNRLQYGSDRLLEVVWEALPCAQERHEIFGWASFLCASLCARITSDQ